MAVRSLVLVRLSGIGASYPKSCWAFPLLSQNDEARAMNQKME